VTEIWPKRGTLLAGSRVAVLGKRSANSIQLLLQDRPVQMACVMALTDEEAWSPAPRGGMISFKILPVAEAVPRPSMA